MRACHEFAAVWLIFCISKPFGEKFDMQMHMSHVSTCPLIPHGLYTRKKACTLSRVMWYGHLGSLSNQSGDDILLKSICIAFRGGHTPALRPRKVPKPRWKLGEKKTMKKHRENEKANFRVARIWELRQLRVLNQLPSQHQCRSAKHQLFWCNLLRWGVGH